MTPPPRRRTRDELRELLVATGVALAQEGGLGTGADQLTFARVFARLEAHEGVHVTNASVIGRIWDSVDDYRLEVMATVAAYESLDLSDQVLGRAAAVFEDGDRSTPEGRAAAVAELCRTAGEASMELVTASMAWRLQIGAWALAVAGAEADWFGPVRRAITAGYDVFTAHNRTAYGAMADHFGYRLRPGRTLEQFTVAVDALADGCALRAAVMPDEVRSVCLPTGPDGANQEWTLLGVAIHALIRQFFELVPGWTPDGGDPGAAA